MTQKFDPKKYKGKTRVYPAVPGAPGIRRLWTWNEETQTYEAGSYEARRYESIPSGEMKRVKRSFGSLQEARDWQHRITQGASLVYITGPTLAQIIADWRKRSFSGLATGTQLLYDRTIRHHFSSLLDIPVRQLEPKRLDKWIEELKDASKRKRPSRTTRSFDHELTLLGTILRHYVEYEEDGNFVFPIKKRHRSAVRAASKQISRKDLSEDEFKKFRGCLFSSVNGRLYAALATVQFYQALRISEAAAICWDDVHLSGDDPANSRLSIVRSIFWPRCKGIKSHIKAGFKNSDSNGGLKEQPLFPESYSALREMAQEGTEGLIFSVKGTHLEYRQIQHAYDQAFKRAKLPYRGTHIMRHGGCRRVYNKVGDTAVAQQILGNADLGTTLIYAKRKASALTEVAVREWNETGRNWSQTIDRENNS